MDEKKRELTEEIKKLLAERTLEMINGKVISKKQLLQNVYQRKNEKQT